MGPLVLDSYPVNSLAHPLLVPPSLLGPYPATLSATALYLRLRPYWPSAIITLFIHFYPLSHQFNEARLHLFRGFDYFDGHRLCDLFALTVACFALSLLLLFRFVQHTRLSTSTET